MRALPRLLLIAAVVLAAVFFADHPGRVEIVWQGWLIDTSVGVLVVVGLLVAVVVAGLLSVTGAVLGFPGLFMRRRHDRRRRAGYRALTRGMVAVAAGDAQEAQRQARKADLLLAEPPLTLLLSAQAAQLNGDESAAQRFFAAMLDRPETEFLGLRGLLNQAERAGDTATALRLAERARSLRPGTPWVVESMLDLQARAGHWETARDTLAEAVKRGVVAPERGRHVRGVILHELSLAAEQRGERRQAVALAAKAQALTPDLAGPACHHARLLLDLRRPRPAAKALERAWRHAPHPDLARLYRDIHRHESPQSRLASLERLAAQHPQSRESHLMLAEAALDARLSGEARQHLEQAARVPPPGPTPRLCLLMARLEEVEHLDAGKAIGSTGGGAAGPMRRWLDRAVDALPDPRYVCAHCGGEALEWHALCPHCGGFDTMSWRTPARAGAEAALEAAMLGSPLPPPPASAEPEIARLAGS